MRLLSRGRRTVTQELLYTSAAQGLDPGSRGFCTVVRTRGMPAPLAPLLESLSGYRPAFALNDPRAAENPVSYSHVRVAAGGKTYSVLSRVADYGLDYSQRTNKIAHHVALASDERPEAGPAWLLAQPGFMDTRWDGQPRTLPAGRRVPTGVERAAACPSWAAITGDAGWAGVLAESFLTGTGSYLIFAAGTDTLALLREAVALLPPHKRWDATFSTYYTGLPGSASCSCRCVLADSPEAVQAARLTNVLRIALNRQLPRAQGGPLVEVARTGQQKVSRTPAAVAPVISHNVSIAIAPSTSDGGAYSLRKSPAEPPPMRVRQPPSGDSTQRPKRAWIWWLSGSIAAALVLGVGGLWALVNRQIPSVSGKGGDRQNAPEAVVPQAVAKVDPATEKGGDKKASRPQSKENPDKKPRVPDTAEKARAAQIVKKSEGDHSKSKPAPASVTNGGNDPKKSPSDVRPNPAPKQLEDAKHGPKTAAVAVVEKKPEKNSASVKTDRRGPSVSCPAFLAKDDVGPGITGPVDVGKDVAAKHFLIVPWLPMPAANYTAQREPSERLSIAFQGQPDPTIISTSANRTVTLKVESHSQDLGAARYCLLEIAPSDGSAEPSLFQLFTPRSQPVTGPDRETGSERRIISEWPLPARLAKTSLPAIVPEFVSLSDGKATFKFVFAGERQSASATLIPTEQDYDFFAEHDNNPKNPPPKIPRLFLRYVGIKDESPADAIAVMYNSFNESLRVGEKRLLAKAAKTLRMSPVKLKDLVSAVQKERETLNDVLNKQRDTTARAATQSQLQDLANLDQRRTRWQEIREILKRPYVVEARVLYRVEKGEKQHNVTLIDFRKTAIDVK